MKECKYCKTLNKDDYVYCINCGRKLTADVSNRSLPDLKGFKPNKKIIIAIAGLLAVLAGALFLFTRPSNKETYYLSEDKVQYVVGEKGIYFFEGGNKKAELPEVLPDTNSYSFDNRTLLFGGIKEEKN
ncbi:MAG: hypothetical protein IKS69_03425, partial [Erysipelotrichaceae bacterium]|nr:hypothetical protein [Erysipelotrichaceae bacterium]